MRDYFLPGCVFPDDYFCRRFRMSKRLFTRIEEALAARNDYFVQKSDAVGVIGLSTKQKIIAAVRMLAYEQSADQWDEYLRIGESTSLDCLKHFCQALIEVFGAEYLRSPTAADTERILRDSAGRGFPGMLGSLDCMHWEWKICPIAHAGQFQNRSKVKTVILEAVATYDLWIWHNYFGEPGSNSDLNVLDHSPLFNDYLKGILPTATFTVNHRLFRQPYYLADGIYPPWPVFMKTISQLHTPPRKLFAKVQEAHRKDIERTFGVLYERKFCFVENGMK